MGASPFSQAIEQAAAPLRGADPEVFARDGEERRAVADALARAGTMAIPRDVATRLGRIAERFASPLPPARAARTVARALEALEPWADPAFADAAQARSCAALPGVGPKRAEILERRGLGSVGDLLFHLPVRYDDRRRLLSVGELEVGRRVTFVARVLVADFSMRRGRARRVFEAVVGDETGTVTLKWFHGGDAISRVARKDALLLVTGDVKRYRFSKELIHPEIERLADEEAEHLDPGRYRSVVPDYPTPEGIHPRALRRAVEAAVAQYADLVAGHLPEAVVREQRLPEPPDALRELHAPSLDVDLEGLRGGASRARARLVLEELYLLELGLALRRERQGREPGIAIPPGGEAAREAERALPFALTGAQRRALGEIRADLARPHPMSRLLQGDVGSGKTAVAFLASVEAAASGFQTALMAPTELLAEQHARTLRRLATAGGLRIALLTASQPRAESDAVRAALAAGTIDLVVGTHALVQQGVAFHRLALVIVDEQHRFGVLQRAALAAKAAGGRAPHTLVMTATPIPRTLALTLYGDLDLSVIDELPPGRRAPATLLLRTGEGRRIVELLRETVGRGEQVYVVYPLVEESEKSDLRAASESAERLRRAFPDLAVDLVHGRLDAEARAEAMGRFERGETHVLVSTTVIEVGVDVPGATLMIVEHAERFGLAQLHQLRGRVGRGDRDGTCVLVARGSTGESEERLRALLATGDGFQIAEADLRIRGPGEFLGTRQHGRLPDLRIADLVRDARHVATARQAALATVRADAELRGAPELRRAVERRWGERLALADVG